MTSFSELKAERLINRDKGRILLEHNIRQFSRIYPKVRKYILYQFS